MNYMEFTHKDKVFERVSKAYARKHYADTPIYIYPCKMKPFGFWGMGVLITDSDRSFDSIVNEFEFFNCNSETGEYAAFCREIQ